MLPDAKKSHTERVKCNRPLLETILETTPSCKTIEAVIQLHDPWHWTHFTKKLESSLSMRTVDTLMEAWSCWACSLIASFSSKSSAAFSSCSLSLQTMVFLHLTPEKFLLRFGSKQNPQTDKKSHPTLSGACGDASDLETVFVQDTQG